jgi:hypothetical protein
MKDIETIQNSDSPKSSSAAQFENATQKLTQDLSLKQISQVLIQNWPLFLILFSVFSLASIAIFSFKVPFVSTASVIVNDSQNSSLQSFAQQFTGSASGKLNEAKKSNSPLQKYLEYLKTTEFYSKLIASVESNMNSQSFSVPEKSGQQKFIKEILFGKKMSELNLDDQISVYKNLESLLSYKIATDYELEISTSSKSKELSLFLTNTALKVISEELQKKESAELLKIQDFLKAQKNLIDTELQSLNKKMSDFSSKPENLISLSSSSKVGEYISELMMRKNETRMKIAENNKMIGYLKAASAGRRENALYGNAGRAQSIQLENDMLNAKLNDIQNSIDRVSNQAKNLPAMNQNYEDIKKKSDIEFSKYKDVSEALSKTEAYQLSLSNKFEVLEKARFEKVKPLVSLLTLLLVAFVLSQILGSLIIYVTTIWDSSLVTAQSTRNVVVIDSHSLDPRVIIENSKIKFRLRHSEFDSANNQSEGSDHKKIGFNFMKKAEGDDQKSEG